MVKQTEIDTRDLAGGYNGRLKISEGGGVRK